MYIGALLALLAVTASAQPFLPGTGFLPLGAPLSNQHRSIYCMLCKQLQYTRVFCPFMKAAYGDRSAMS